MIHLPFVAAAALAPHVVSAAHGVAALAAAHGPTLAAAAHTAAAHVATIGTHQAASVVAGKLVEASAAGHLLPTVGSIPIVPLPQHAAVAAGVATGAGGAVAGFLALVEKGLLTRSVSSVAREAARSTGIGRRVEDAIRDARSAGRETLLDAFR